MFDEPKSATRIQRARGRARVGLVLVDGRTRLKDLHQSGSAKAFLPRAHGPAPEVVFLNTAGGLTGGDQLDYALDLGPGGRVTATTQTAERAYASAGGTAAMTVRMRVGAGAALTWVPQETIVFDRSALHRDTQIDLTGDAQVLLAEMIVLGRVAMGEVISTLDFQDRRRVTRDGAPVFNEPLALGEAALARIGGSALLGAARAFATLAVIAPGAEDQAARIAPLLSGRDGVSAAVSGWDGKCVVRATATDAAPLKRLMAQVISLLGPLPRVWNC